MNPGAKKIFSFFLLALLALTFLSAKKQNSPSLNNLPERYQHWLTDEVVYIITPIEREVFLQLISDPERELFIKAFWKQRDPNPNTPENEFQIEHYRRIKYANNWFGKDSPAPGWKTDMGRIYIQLGEPKSTEKIENESGIYPMVIWYYQGLTENGLPNAFNVVFFQKGGSGEFELYSPVRYGPQYLMPNYIGDMTNYENAYLTLLKVNPEIAQLSLSLIPGENTGYSPSIASEFLIQQKIPEAPSKKINTIYAEKMLRYKDMVEVDYSINYIESTKFVTIIRDDASGIYFVHYLIEPKKLSIEQYSRNFYATLEIFGNIVDAQNKSIFQFNKTVPLQLNEEQMARIKDKLFSYQDMFPLVPGKYKLTILLKNTVSKEFTSIEKDIEIPETVQLGLGPLVLANRLIENSSYQSQSKPFLIADKQLVPSPRNDFLTSDTLSLYFQINGLNDELKAGGVIRYDILKTAENVLSFTKKVSDYPTPADIIEQIPLANLKPENYTIRVTLLSAEKKALDTKESYFYITPMPSLPRPWVVSTPLSSTHAPQYLNDLGNQYLNLNNPQKALPLLEQAFHLSPQTTKFALDYSRLLLELKEFTRVKDIASPLFKNASKFELALILAQASQALNQYGEAVDYYQQYIAHFGSNPKILNALGECHMGMGNSAEALKAWEKSLAIDPQQEKIKQRVSLLKGVKNEASK